MAARQHESRRAQEIAIARQHLPAGYSRQLPRLRDDTALYGLGAGQPRIFDLALNAVCHGDGRLVLRTLTLYLAAYQRRQSLRLGELWAFPIMLRLALIENQRRVALAVASSRQARDRAMLWAERMLAAATAQPDTLILVVADLARAGVALDATFVAELSRRLQGRATAMAMPLSWLEQRVIACGQTVDALCAEDNRQQAEWQLSVADSIGSLRLLDATDWRDFVEQASQVERTLRQDPAGVYARMDFASRDSYRHVVEQLARRCRCDENEVARQAVERAGAQRRVASNRGTVPPRETHVGYHLVAEGRAAFEAQCTFGPTLSAVAAAHSGSGASGSRSSRRNTSWLFTSRYSACCARTASSRRSGSCAPPAKLARAGCVTSCTWRCASRRSRAWPVSETKRLPSASASTTPTGSTVSGTRSPARSL